MRPVGHEDNPIILKGDMTATVDLVIRNVAPPRLGKGGAGEQDKNCERCHLFHDKSP
jgi:hypothetical protein